MSNLKLAFRMLVKTPFVTIVAILSLALGIGANTAIFSVFDQLLRRPLPVEDPERLVNLLAPGPKPGSTSCNSAGPCEAVFSYPMFRDLEKGQTPFTALAAHRLFGANLAANGQTFTGDGARRVGPLLRHARHPARARTVHRSRRRSRRRGRTRRGAELRLLAEPVRGQPGRAHHAARRQRPVDDDRRGRAARLRRHHDRAKGRWSSSRSRCVR